LGAACCAKFELPDGKKRGTEIMTTTRPGHYRHFKGKDYEVLGVARHSETEEEMVVYRTLYGDFSLWVQPAALFEESTVVDGEATPRFAYVGPDRPVRLLSVDAQARARSFIETSGRALERSLYSYHFEQGSAEAVLAELGRFQNDDGGFGHGIEPDLQTPDSSVLGTTVALQIVRSLQVREQHPLVRAAMRYLADTYDAAHRYWPFIPPTVDNAPHAPWWNPEGRVGNHADQMANPRAEVIGYLFEHPSTSTQDQRSMLLRDALAWLQANSNTIEMHEYLCYRRLAVAPGLPEAASIDLDQRLQEIAVRLIAAEPSNWSSYGLRPLDAIDAPDSRLVARLHDAISYNLDYVIENQRADGSWRPTWTWGDTYPQAWLEAERQWSGVITLEQLLKLRKFGRLEVR
jgi:hypothetical protein